MPRTPGSRGERIAELNEALKTLQVDSALNADKILQIKEELQTITRQEHSRSREITQKIAATAETLQNQSIETLQKELQSLETTLENIQNIPREEGALDPKELDAIREGIESYKLAIEKKQNKAQTVSQELAFDALTQRHPLQAIAPEPGSRGEKLEKWLIKLREAQSKQDTRNISKYQDRINELIQNDSMIWKQAKENVAKINKKAEEILAKDERQETLAQNIKESEQRYEEGKKISTAKSNASPTQLETLRINLEANKLALEKSKTKAQEKKDNLLKPLKSKKLELTDTTIINALSTLRNKGESSSLNPETLAELKQDVIRLIEDKTFKKLLTGSDGSIEFIHAMSLVRNRENVRFAHSLGKFKRNINKALYPTYGFQINALENYIQDLKDAGVKADNNPIKPVIFKSDRAKKLHLAQELLTDLIQFENKPKTEQATDTSITPGKIQEIIDSNKKATGPTLLHGQGELDKILKNIKEKAANPQNESMSAKAHRKQKQRDSYSKLTAFRQALKKSSSHSFKGEIDRINQYRNKLYRNSASFPGFNYHFTKNGKENLKLSNQLIELLVNSDLDPKNDAESMRKREILESRVLAMLANPKLDKELRIVLDEINTRIKIPKAPGPQP